MSAFPDSPPDWPPLSGSICRVCLQSIDPVATWSLFECSVAGRSLVEALSVVGGIQIQTGDNFPKSCCSDCLKQVEAALKLRELCQESNRRLAQMFAVTVKNEPPEGEEEEDSFVVSSHGCFEPAEDNSVASVLQHFGLDGFIATVEGQDLESIDLFSCLLEQDLQKMLPNETVGTIIRFRKAVAHAKQLLSKSSSDERKAKTREPESIPRKKRRLPEPLLEQPQFIVANPNQDHVNLPALLQTFEGQCIMTLYRRNGNQLDNHTQGKLLKLIVEQLATSVRMQDIQRSWFEAIFASIVQAFPSESELAEVYRGKLQQIRYKLTRKIKHNSRIESAEQSNVIAVNGDEETVDESEAIASKLWLQSEREPWKSVLLHWEKSFLLRNKIYQCVDSNKLAELYRDDGWPILKQPNAIDLIRQDFNRMFAPTSDIFQVWPRIKKAVCTFGRLNLKNKNLLAVLAKFEEGGYTDDHLFIQLLAGLLPPGVATKKFRPKFEEINNAFLREIKSSADIPEVIERYRTTLAEHKLSVQPHVLFIADECRYLIYVAEGRLYEATGLLDAVDGVLKVCLVLRLSYTSEAKPMWTFVQRFCYGVKTDSDNSYACLRSLQAFLLQAQDRE